MDKVPSRWIFWGMVAALCIGAPLTLGAGPRETNTADRLAMLYAPQFNFTRSGEPLVHLGVLDGVGEAELGADGALRVVAPGSTSPQVLLDGRKPFSVRIEKGLPGQYRHWVVVQRLPYGQPRAVEDAIDAWADRGYLATPHEVGGLFAVGGRRFDSRIVLLGVGGYDGRDEAQELAERLESYFGIETEMHTELLRHASGSLILEGGGLKAPLTQQDVLWLSPEDPESTWTLKTPKGKQRFAGSMVFTADRTGKLAVINAVPVETVVKGVVPSEVYTSAPMEALKAQAVAARGYVLGALGVRHLADPYLLCSQVHCQAYSGLSHEHPRTNRAVEETRGVVMFESSSLQGDWRIVDARYSSSCGGHTEHNELVWGGEPEDYLRGHMDLRGKTPRAFAGGITDANVERWINGDVEAWCNTANFGGKNTFRWDRTAEIAEVQKNLDARRRIGRLKDVQILRRGVSGRIIEMRFVGEHGDFVLDRELAIRRVFGGLRSSMFLMEIDRDAQGFPRRFRFKGGGFGHGAGMCQTGAMVMGSKEHTYDQILHHYYQSMDLKKLY